MRCCLLLIWLVMSASLTFSQPPARILSPEVQADGRVTFRFPAPNAVKVELELEGQRDNTPMQKDEQGIWSATIGPLQPDFYGYGFIADGVGLTDPANPLRKPNLLTQESEVHVPGAGLPWEISDVPYGTVHHHFYHSKIANDDRDMYVYTPPGYDRRKKKQYPVLYLLHGFSDDASGWTAVGRANVILDNLIAQAKVRPMIVVMPLGYGDATVVGQPNDPWQRKQNLSRFTDMLFSEIIPQVESQYRVKAGRESRAIAGLSMGGAESLLTGLNHLDQFAWVGAFSSGNMHLESFDAGFPGFDAGANRRLKLLWIACGTDDDLITVNREFKSWLKGKGVQFTDVETPGMHTWMVWRRNLAALAPLLFK